jgi:transposase
LTGHRNLPTPNLGSEEVLPRPEDLRCGSGSIAVLQGRMKTKRFWLKVDKNGPTQPHMTTSCWLWTGATNQRYGHMRPTSIGISNWSTHLIYAHHASWVFEHGSIPTEMQILHQCGVKLCVNPEHLYAGNASDKGHAMVAAGKHRCWILSYEIAQEIRECSRKGMSRKNIAVKFGITISTVEKIVNKKAWTYEAEQAKRKQQRELDALLKLREAIFSQQFERRELIIRLRAEDLSYAAIGRKVGLSRERVRQILAKTLLLLDLNTDGSEADLAP